MSRDAAPTRRIVLTAGGLLLLPRAARAQTAKRRRIAYLASPSQTAAAPFLGAFRRGLRELGYGDDDIEIEVRYADGNPKRLIELAAELVGLVPEVMVATSTAAIHAATQATSTIAIVMAVPGDPVAAGLIANLSHPGGNVTGLSIVVSSEIAGKWLQLLQTAIPRTKRIAILVNPVNSGIAPYVQVARQAAQTLRLELLLVEARTAAEIDGAFYTMMRDQVAALIVPGDALFFSEKSRIVELTANHKLPAIYQFREFAAIGGLMSYGADLTDNFRRAASYVDKILKGAKPADLPVEQPTKFELVVNLKTARALGLTIPPLILAGADEVIE